MAKLVLATDLSQKLRSSLEFGVAIALIMGLTVLAVGKLESYVIHAQIAEAFSLASTAKSETVIYRAENGVWPSTEAGLGISTLEDDSYIGSFVDRVELGQDGALTSVFSDESAAARLRGRRLTIRPLTLSEDPGAPVLWVCGPHRYPPELIPGGVDETDVDPSDLPSICRDY